MSLLATLALIATTLGLAGDTTEPRELSSTSKWTLDYADNACNIGKTFGSPEQPFTFALKLLPGRGNTVFALMDSRPGKTQTRTGELEITASPETARISVQVISGSVEAGSHIIHGSLSSEELSTLEKADTISFAYRGEVVRLTGVKLKGALAASIACEDDLLRTWGLDVQAFRSISVRAKPRQSPARWISHNDYPPASVRVGEQGAVNVRLDISVTGEVAACTVLSSSGFPRLDQRTCEIMRKRARYEPARLADGTPTTSMTFLRFNWQTYP